MTDLDQALARHGLALFGGVAKGLPEGLQTLLLVGPKEPGFWAVLTASPEWQDKAPDPMDRWSARILRQIAAEFDATPLFPFGGPPWQPFYQWALGSGQAFESPVKLLVHGQAGLMVSYRGALGFRRALPLPKPLPNPCDRCENQPCRSACPVNALSDQAYDLPRCHGHLDRPEGADCMNLGCAARRACPVSQSYARLAEHSAYHMRQFHK